MKQIWIISILAGLLFFQTGIGWLVYHQEHLKRLTHIEYERLIDLECEYKIKKLQLGRSFAYAAQTKEADGGRLMSVIDALQTDISALEMEVLRITTGRLRKSPVVGLGGEKD